MSKREEKQKNMIQAARKLFAAHGFEKTTMQQIADEAGPGVATLFRYFPKKENLMIEVITSILAEQLSYFEQIQRSEGRGIDKTAALFDHYIDYISEDNRDVIKLLEAFEVYLAFSTVEPALLEEVKFSYEKIRSLVKAIIAEGQKDGSILNDQHADSIALSIMNMFGTAVKKYSLYSVIPSDIVATSPDKNELKRLKDEMLLKLQAPDKT